ncbi:ABC transporter permease subunit [Chelatococcus sp.]|uniref:ABC transporter permease n=1 Tax=Chelatococcus sp. TaxID=1953771 RepID=UPI0025C68EB5|nr:ABC transporter permease subunit [Chelatococcus sp.]MBX3556768.1 ABC transporter permease [Chelatococcus sp.]
MTNVRFHELYTGFHIASLNGPSQSPMLLQRSVRYGDARILVMHVWPNVASSVIVFASVSASHALITEAALSFLGLGVQPPNLSWGIMIATGMSYLSEWWISFFPGVAIFLAVLALNVVGDVLRDVLDPKAKS